MVKSFFAKVLQCFTLKCIVVCICKYLYGVRISGTHTSQLTMIISQSVAENLKRLLQWFGVGINSRRQEVIRTCVINSRSRCSHPLCLNLEHSILTLVGSLRPCYCVCSVPSTYMPARGGLWDRQPLLPYSSTTPKEHFLFVISFCLSPLF